MRLQNTSILIVSYLLGCFNTGYYFARFFYKQDIRGIGTNVTGAMNVGRLAGKKGFIITFLGDALKGAMVVWLCRLFRLEDWATLLCILMVIVGHIFPVQLKFRGGKGMSTIFGALLTYNPDFILFILGTCAVLFPFLRGYTVTALFALLIFPMELFLMDYPIRMSCFALAYAAVIIYACRSNLKEYIEKRAYHGKRKKNQ